MSLTTPTTHERDLREGFRDESYDAESDLEDDLVSQHARSSTEIAERDHGLLDEEEEREELLATTNIKTAPWKGFFGRARKGKRPAGIELREKKQQSRRPHKTRKEKKGGGKDEEGELLYEMEEGGETYDTSSQASSSSAEIDKQDSVDSSMPKVIQVSVTGQTWLMLLSAPKVGCVALRGSRKCSSPLRNYLFLDLPNHSESSPDTLVSTLQWHVYLRTYNNPYLSRWLPS